MVLAILSLYRLSDASQNLRAIMTHRPLQTLSCVTLSIFVDLQV
jgi:hypothetical protein